MRIPRCLLDIELIPGSEYALPEANRHHLVNVLRMRAGFSLRVFNGREKLEADAVLLEASKKSASIRLEKVHAAETESPLDILLSYIPTLVRFHAGSLSSSRNWTLEQDKL